MVLIDPNVVDQKPEVPDPKRQKLDPDDENRSQYHYESSTDSGELEDPDDLRLFKEEFEKYGAYDFDASRVGKIVMYHRVKFDENEHTEPPETDRDLVEQLSKIALEKYNEDHNKNFELVRAIKANWHIGGGYIFSITLEAKDKDSPNSEPIPFHARVVHPLGNIVSEVYPKP